MAKATAKNKQPRKSPAKAGSERPPTAGGRRVGDHVEARSIRALARYVGRSEGAVRKWIARDDWPFSRQGPWDAARVRAWAEIAVKPDPAAAYRKKATAAQEGRGEYADLGPLTRARIQRTLEGALKTRVERLVLEGKLHDVAECQQRRARQIHEVKSRLLDLPRSMAASLAMQQAETIERLLADQVVAILEEFAGVREKQVPPPAAGEGDDGEAEAS